MVALGLPMVVPDHSSLTIRIFLQEYHTHILEWEDQEDLHLRCNNQGCLLLFQDKVVPTSTKPRLNIRTLLDQEVQCQVVLHLQDSQEDLPDMSTLT